MKYADYGYYLGDYHGRPVSIEDFFHYAAKAERMLDYVTSGRVDTVTEKVKNAVCAAIEAVHEFNVSLSKIPDGVKSESNDGASVTYQDNSYSNVRKQEDKLMYNAIRRELAGTGLLYRGVR